VLLVPFFVIPQPQLDPDCVRNGTHVVLLFQGSAFATRAEVDTFRQWMRVPSRQRDGSLRTPDTSTWQVIEAESKEAAADIVLRAAFAAAGLPPPPPHPRSRHVQLMGVVQDIDADTGVVTLQRPDQWSGVDAFVATFLLHEETQLRRAAGDIATTAAVVPGVVVLGHGERQDDETVIARALEIHVLPTTR
jgi:hypothetical protein